MIFKKRTSISYSAYCLSTLVLCTFGKYAHCAEISATQAATLESISAQLTVLSSIRSPRPSFSFRELGIKVMYITLAPVIAETLRPTVKKYFSYLVPDPNFRQKQRAKIIALSTAKQQQINDEYEEKLARLQQVNPVIIKKQQEIAAAKINLEEQSIALSAISSALTQTGKNSPENIRLTEHYNVLKTSYLKQEKILSELRENYANTTQKHMLELSNHIDGRAHIEKLLQEERAQRDAALEKLAKQKPKATIPA